MNLRLYKYNNYYNRRVKSFSDLIDLDEFLEYTEYDINFNPNDGVSTEHIIGGINTYNGGADYAVLEDQNEVISRWFIIESQRTRAGQYKMLLKRDSIADYLDKVLEAPCFVEKGWVPDTDPAIFNKEDITFNQIKTRELPVKDHAGIPWLVGYYAKGTELSTSITSLEYEADYTVNGIENWTYYADYQKAKSFLSSVNLNLYFAVGLQNKRFNAHYLLTDYNTRQVSADYDRDKLSAGLYYSMSQSKESANPPKELLSNLFHAIGNNNAALKNTASTLLTGYIQSAEYDTLTEFAEKEYTIFDSSTGVLYKIGANIETGLTPTSTAKTKIPLTSDLGYQLYNIYSGIEGISGNRPTSDSNTINFEVSAAAYSTVQLTLDPISTLASSITINPGGNAQPAYAPYNIFAIPYADNLRCGSGSQGWNIYPSKSLGLRIVNSLIASYGGDGGQLYDVQLLPYCPIPEVNQNMTGQTNKRLNMDLIPAELWGTIKDTESNNVGVFFNCRTTSIQTISSIGIQIKDYKIQNETEFCRLVSPNWNGIYEFSPAKNRGVEYFEIDMELKPYQPYIHVAPKFNRDGLYGDRDNDALGLICGGDFGLTMINNEWARYERQNKNYQNIFDRQVQNLEVQQKWQRLNEQWSAGFGTVGGAVSGVQTGLFMGGGAGAAIGGIAGGALSGLGGAADLYINDQLRSEALDYTRDQFGYQLGNIRALPDSLTKVNSFNPNNTIFPILEFYSCTEQEKEALRNKIKYNGMSIGRIGTLREFNNPSEETYVKGQVILLDIDDDFHLAADIANEIYKGVRI